MRNLIKKVLSDPTVYAITLINLYCIWTYSNDTGKYTTVIYLYWIQSVLIGIFNFIDLLSTTNVIVGDFKMGVNIVNPKKEKLKYSLFFLVHYQFFHVVYLIFLSSLFKWSAIDIVFLRNTVIVLLLSQVVFFIQNKIYYKSHPPVLGIIFFAPYMRIIPMHLMILIPPFFHISHALIFLILKMFFDVAGYIVTNPAYTLKWKSGLVQ